MSLAIHFCSEIAPFLVYHITVMAQQCHGFNGESKHGLGALLVKPLHETLLKPRQTFPVGLGTVGEIEVSKKALEIGFVIIGYVPEHCLIVAGSCRLVY